MAGLINQKFSKVLEVAVTFEERFEFLFHSIQSHKSPNRELHEAIGKTNAFIDKLVAVTNEDANPIRALVCVAEGHEQRISGL